MVDNRYKCTAEMHAVCVNNAFCHLCDGESMFKDPVAEQKQKRIQREKNREEKKRELFKTHQKEKKEGMAFEKKVAEKWNNKFTPQQKRKKPAKPRLDLTFSEEAEEDVSPDTEPVTPPFRPIRHSYKPRGEAQRQANSGAMWHAKGDIKLEHALLECKERGTTNSRGEKTISIPKDWLIKQEKEAFQEQRDFWYLPFGYKNDDEVYLVKPFDHEMEIIHELRRLRKENEEMKQKLEELE